MVLQEDIRSFLNLDLLNVFFYVTEFLHSFNVLHLQFIFVASKSFLHDIFIDFECSKSSSIRTSFHSGVLNTFYLSFRPSLFLIFLLLFHTFIQQIPHLTVSLSSYNFLFHSILLVRFEREEITCFFGSCLFPNFLFSLFFYLLLQSRVNYVFLPIKQVLFPRSRLFKRIFNLADYIQFVVFLFKFFKYPFFLLSYLLHDDIILQILQSP